MLENTNGKSIIKKKGFWISLVAVLAIIILFFRVGYNVSYIQLKDKKVDYDQLASEIEKKKEELQKINSEYENKETEFNDAVEIIENRKNVEKEIQDITAQVTEKKLEIVNLDVEIETKTSELASITGQIEEKKSEPKVLSAGFFTVGTDIPEGRYKVVPNGENGNFFVNDGASVNIMLGKGEYYQEEYIFYAYEGDVIELTLSAKFIPIE